MSIDIQFYDNDELKIFDQQQRILLEDVKYKANKKFYDNIQGGFSFVNTSLGNARIEINMLTPQAEYAVGKLLLGELDDIDEKRLGPFLDIVNYIPFARDALISVYLDSIKFLNAEVIDDEKIINPLTNRSININGRTFRNIYKSIKLFGEFIPLVKYDEIEYDLSNGSCFPSALKEILGVKITNRILNKIISGKKITDGFTIDEIEKIMINRKQNCIIRAITGDIIEEIKGKKSWRGKKLEFILTQNHVNTIHELKCIDNSPIYLEGENYKTVKNRTLLTDDLKLFEKLKQNNKSQIEHTIKRFYYNTNLIIFDDLAKEKCDIVQKAENKVWSAFCVLMKKIGKIKGYIPENFINHFYGIRPERILQIEDGETKYVIDQNKSYSYQLTRNDIILPVADISIKITKYKGEYITGHYFYNIDISKTDDIIAPFNNMTCSGYTVKKLQSEKQVKKINWVYKSHTNLRCKDLKDKYSHKLKVRFVGVLGSKYSCRTIKYDNVSNIEAEALSYIYGTELSYDRNNKQLLIHKNNKLYNSGILAHLVVKELTNIDLYEKNKEILRLNPNAILNRVYVDSLGYNCSSKFKYGKLGKKPGMFKIEKSKTGERRYQFYNNIEKIDIPKYKKPKKLKQKDILKLIKDKKGFKLLGGPGYGKSYNINNVITKECKRLDYKYLVFGATRENSKDLNTGTFDKYIYKKSDYEIQQLFNKVDFIIIDEASQLTQFNLFKLDFIRRNCNTSIILVGDPYQCKAIDTKTPDSHLVGWFCNQLCDYNEVILVWHKNARYTKELDDFLIKFKKLWRNHKKRNEHVINNLKIATDETEKKLCYNVQLSKDIGGKTVHTAQGKTIDEPYTIYQVESEMKYRPNVLYTAISRGRNMDDIYIVLDDEIEKK